MRRRGFSLIETLLALVLLVTVLGVSTSVMMGDQRVASRQVSVDRANEDLRLSMVRLNEIMTLAAYIYPSNQTITFRLPGATSNTTVTTGAGALAFLIPYGSPFCRVASPTAANRSSYCAYLYRVEARTAAHATLMGAAPPNSGGSVIAEYSYQWLTWAQNTAPGTNWTGLTSRTTSAGLITDLVESGSTNLGSLFISPFSGTGYDSLQFSASVTDVANAQAQIGGGRPEIVVRIVGNTVRLQQNINPRAIPRVVPPGTGVN